MDKPRCAAHSVALRDDGVCPVCEEKGIRKDKDGRVVNVQAATESAIGVGVGFPVTIRASDDKDGSVRARLTKPERELLLAVTEAVLLLVDKLVQPSATTKEVVEGVVEAMQKVLKEPE